MKSFIQFILLLFIGGVFTACKHNVEVSTVVHEDGSLERNVTLAMDDSASLYQNMFGISEGKGWQATLTRLSDKELSQLKENGESNKGEFMIQFKKQFSSVDEANSEMSAGTDTLFRINSTFEKKFRWFYTYLRYTDRYLSANRFRYVSPEDYFTPEDHAFISRLPADGTPISKADSIYLKGLNAKIESDFAQRGMYEEYFHAFQEVLQKNNTDQRWIDTLNKYKLTIYQYEVVLKEDKKEDSEDIADYKFFFRLADSLHIPLPPHAQEDYEKSAKEIGSRVEFMNDVITGGYVHSIEMPWPVVYTNADSLAGTRAIWKPHYLKFGLADYTMVAESRKMNYVPAGASVAIVIFSVVLWMRRRGRNG